MQLACIIFPETLQYDIWCTFLCLQGILFSTPECLKAPMDFVRLWLHEASRVYGDKLIEEKDMELFSKMKFNIAKDSFEVMHALTLFVILAKLYYSICEVLCPVLLTSQLACCMPNMLFISKYV